jgi:hypothetical protein
MRGGLSLLIVEMSAVVLGQRWPRCHDERSGVTPPKLGRDCDTGSTVTEQEGMLQTSGGTPRTDNVTPLW